MFKTEGGGVKGVLNNVQKNYKFGDEGLPLLPKDIIMQAQKLCPQIFPCDSMNRAARRSVDSCEAQHNSIV